MPVVPRVHVERVVADNQPIDLARQAPLPSGTSRVEIDYAAMHFAAPKRMRYRYKLEGYDTEWVDAGASQRAVFTNLPPRPYRFIVNARSLGGDWTDANVTWEFAVSPAFYQRRLFQAGAVIAIGLLILAAWELKRRQDRERLGLVLAERTRLSREIHDTLLQGMAGTALHLGFISQSLALSSQEKVAQELEEARNRLESYVRETRNKIWDLRSQWLIANDFHKGVRDMIRSISVGSAVKVNVRVVGTARPAQASMEEQTLKIAHEAVTNAIRHGRGSLVNVELHFRRDDLMLRVADNGAGIQVNGQQPLADPSWGLIGMRERAERIGAKLMVEPGVDGGTELVAVVPWTAR